MEERIQIVLLTLVCFGLLPTKSGYTTLPEEQRVRLNGSAVFHCQNPSARTIGWLLDGERVTAGTLDGVFPHQQSTDSGIVNTLIIQAYPIYNESTIQCQAHLDTQEVETTAPVKLLIQGPPGAVGNITRKGQRVSWSPPFSLDLTDVDPDIDYCLQVYNITQEQTLLLDECDILTPFYIVDILCNPCLYSFIVIPVIHESGINGTLSSSTEAYVSLYIKAVHIDGNFSIWIYLNKGVGDVTPARYSVSLTSTDGVAEDRSIGTEIVHENDSSLTLLIIGLPRHQRWSAEILVPGSSSNPLASRSELSTHEVQNVTASSLQPGEITVAGDIVEGSNVTDLLVYVYSVTTGRFLYHHYHRTVEDRNVLNFNIPVRRGGMYYIWLVTFKKDKTLSERAATSAIPVNVTSSKDVKLGKLTFDYNVSSNSSGISVTCTFVQANATACLAIVHTALPFFNNSIPFEFMVVASFKFARKGDTAEGFITGYTLDRYRVGAVEIVEIDSKGAGKSIVAAILPAVLVASLALASVLACFITIAKKKKKSGTGAISQQESHNLSANNLLHASSSEPSLAATLSEKMPILVKKSNSHEILRSAGTCNSTDSHPVRESGEIVSKAHVYVTGGGIVEDPRSGQCSTSNGADTRKNYFVEDDDSCNQESKFGGAITETETRGSLSSFLCGRRRAGTSHELPHSQFQRDMNSKAAKHVSEQNTDGNSQPGPSTSFLNQHTQVVGEEKLLTDSILPTE